MASTDESDDSHTGVTTPDLLPLHYHEDITLVHWPVIFRGSNPAQDEMESRRLLFYNIPPSVTPLQVARSAAAFGQVLSIHEAAPAVRGTVDGTTTMLVEFAAPDFAVMCQNAYNGTGQVYFYDTSDQYMVGIWIIPTPSFPVARGRSLSLTEGYTRTISIAPVPVDCVWFMICAVAAPRDILDAEYDGATRTLTVEFTSVDVTHRSASQLENGLFDFIFDTEAVHKNVDFVFDTEAVHKNVGICADRVGYGRYTTCVPELKQRFDYPPFNEYWPDTYYYVMTQRNLHPRSRKRNMPSSDDEPRGRSRLATGDRQASSSHAD